jgi:membrane dipeptidase
VARTDPFLVERPLNARASCEFGLTAQELRRSAVVIDLVSPLFSEVFPRSLDEYLAGGVTTVGASVNLGVDEQGDAAAALRGIAEIHDLLRRAPERTAFVYRIEDIHVAKRTEKLGVILHFQNSTPFERNVEYVELFYRLGGALSAQHRRDRNLMSIWT